MVGVAREPGWLRVQAASIFCFHWSLPSRLKANSVSAPPETLGRRRLPPEEAAPPTSPVV